MSFVGNPFEHDIFVTYSHGDVHGDGTGMLKEWSEGFCTELEGEINFEPEIAGRVNIFRDEDRRKDRNLERHSPTKDKLKQKVEKSALLAVLMSRDYIDSKWCTDERTWWQEHAEILDISTSGRILLVQIVPTTERPWPSLLKDSDGNNFPGRVFFDLQNPRRPYEWPRPDENSRGEFRRELVKLAGEVRDKLIGLQKKLNIRRQAEIDRQTLGDIDEIKTIYLHARKDSKDAWDSESERLQERGFLMSAASPDPAYGDAKRQEQAKRNRIDGILKSDALLLLKTEDPNSLNDDLISIGRFDRMEARDQCNKLLPCAVYDTVKTDLKFDIVKRNADQLNIDWLTGTPETPPDIQGWLSKAAL